jgi:hypothetical protein
VVVGPRAEGKEEGPAAGGGNASRLINLSGGEAEEFIRMERQREMSL